MRKISVEIPRGSRFVEPADLLEVERGTLAYHGAFFEKGEAGLPLQNDDKSYTVHVVDGLGKKVVWMLEKGYNFTAVLEEAQEVTREAQ